MDNKSNEQLLIMQAKIESNRQESDGKMKNPTEYPKEMITSTITSIMYQI